MNIKLLALLIILFFQFQFISGQTRTYTTSKLTGTPPEIDGVLDDPAWQILEWEGDFIQHQPNNGEKASQKTAFKILYDHDYIYVAFKAYDTEKDKIAKRMTRRDGFDGDLVGIMFDSYYDKRTSFFFVVNAAGVKSDAIQTDDNGDMMDDSWDPIWFTKTSYDDEGWNAEMKIPISQLRFSKKDEQIWGLEVARLVFRENELSFWNHIPKDASGWTSLYGELKGLNSLKPKKQIEIAPYLVGKLDKYEKDDKNPYATGTDYSYNIGLDGKIGITNNMILDFTINPDFGQVEADPSEVNLSAFESYFSEKRPFFIEGKNITDYQITPGGHPWASDNLFYSRRVGRAPQGEPSLTDSEYLKMPDNTKILGAFKLTGKTKDGWSVGIIENIANQEKAEINNQGQTRKEIVEPYTNYLIGRVQKDINKGNTIIGAMYTTTNRKLEVTNMDYLNKNAITGGLDFQQFFLSKKYFVSAKFIASKISGSQEAILEQQMSPRRYYQRPDANYLKVDSNRTSLSGHGGTFLIGKQENSGFRFLFNATWRSPGLELNDVGYLRQANTVFQFLWAGYSITKPFSIFRRIDFNANQWAGWDFGAVNLFNGVNFSIGAEFTNQWQLGFGVNRDFDQIDNTMLWGGPSMKIPGDWNYFAQLSSNSTKKLHANISFSQTFGSENYMSSTNSEFSLNYRPFDFVSFSLSPSYSVNKTELQYIDESSFNNQARYIFGTIEQNTFVLTARIDLNIKPDLTLQYYASPFISSGDYYDIKRITDPMADNYQNRYHTFSSAEITYSEPDQTYSIDESGDGIVDYAVGNPNFNFKQFRSNLVLRWEYTPGSLIYVVWSQGKTKEDSYGSFDYLNDMNKLFSVVGHNTFLIKISHRFRAR